MRGQSDQDNPKPAASEGEIRVGEQAQEAYSAIVLELAQNPKNMGRLPEPDVKGLVHGWCGDTMEIYLQLEGDRIERASFATDGCGATLACGSAITSLVQGVSLEEAGEIRPEQVITALGGLPAQSQHCAVLAVSTLQNALFNWRGMNEMGVEPGVASPEDREREAVATQAGEMLRQGYH